MNAVPHAPLCATTPFCQDKPVPYNPNLQVFFPPSDLVLRVSQRLHPLVKDMMQQHTLPIKPQHTITHRLVTITIPPYLVSPSPALASTRQNRLMRNRRMKTTQPHPTPNPRQRTMIMPTKNIPHPTMTLQQSAKLLRRTKTLALPSVQRTRRMMHHHKHIALSIQD